MDVGTVWCRAAVVVTGRDARAARTGRVWLVAEDGVVWTPIERRREGAMVVQAGAPYCAGGPGVVMVPAPWLTSWRSGPAAAALRQLAAHVATVARRQSVAVAS